MEVLINTDSGDELARLTITRLEVHGPESEYANYSVKVAVERGGAVGLHQRSLHNFPHMKYNVLGLALQALSTLSEEELELEQADSPDMDREQRGTLREIQAWASRLYRD